MKKIFLLLAFISNIIFYNAQNWNQIIKLVNSDRTAGDKFGVSVAVDGEYAIVGASTEDEDADGNNNLISAGSAYIFKLENGNWTQKQKIVASDRNSVDVFGYSVAIKGDYIVVGAYQEDHDLAGENSLANAGSAYIFKKNGNGVWEQVQKIIASDRAASDYFGYKVALSGDYIAIGAHQEDEDTLGANTISNAGSVYIFRKNENNIWIQQQKIIASDREVNARFGFSLAIDGDQIAVGSYSKDINGNADAGAVYTFKLENGAWVQKQILTSSDYEGNDYFGYSIGISGNYIIAGAYQEGTASSTNPGSAYVFKADENGVWSQLQKLTASDRTEGDHFGFSVAISGNRLIAGARWEDENANGSNPVANAGSAYIFSLSDGAWSQTAKIVASVRGVNDNFGTQVAISGDHAFVGAQDEDEDQNDANTMDGAGSVYVYKYTGAILGATAIGKPGTLSIYPNPTSGLISIRSEKKVQSAELYNLEGRKVLISNDDSFDLSILPVGNYLLKIKYVDGSVNTRKVIKK